MAEQLCVPAPQLPEFQVGTAAPYTPTHTGAQTASIACKRGGHCHWLIRSVQQPAPSEAGSCAEPCP
ncbi:hypothetical protein HaLaN_08724 [Haematococcus lacustris]|uniref:Uncharacterized protein n=1 Tax=Haematococcus lacustris TaxID=44745 RepID=A0A699YSZ0_HAELA|nr:hypothetical protein HaLaN_08724 [Haematococcus lacustris]